MVIFLPLFFSTQFDDIALLAKTVVAFIAFSACASAIYIFNDAQDVAFDRKHPIKKNRPIASGSVSVKTAYTLMGILLILSTAVMFVLSVNAGLCMVIYILMNIAYSKHFKHIAIVDVSIIGAGFVLRLLVGSVTTQTPLSMWIVIMMFLLALFLALAKRRDDVLVYLDTGNRMRKVVDGYNLIFIDNAMATLASVIIVSYLLYTTSSDIIEQFDNEYVYLTTFFVILCILRYLQLTFVEKKSGDPVTIFLQDRFLQISLLSWVVVFSGIIYF
jgi:4-hydroxybenzoate polyprenyltransferase